MSQQQKAIYEDGILRLLEPVQLEDHQELALVLERFGSARSRWPAAVC